MNWKIGDLDHTTEARNKSSVKSTVSNELVQNVTESTSAGTVVKHE